MGDLADEGGPTAPPSVRDHLANERTLLAWIRTALTVIGLGFIVDRLAIAGDAAEWQSWAGVALVLVGALVAVAGAVSYMNARRELATGAFRPQVWLHMALVGLVVIGALTVAGFLLLD